MMCRCRLVTTLDKMMLVTFATHYQRMSTYVSVDEEATYLEKAHVEPTNMVVILHKGR